MLLSSMGTQRRRAVALLAVAVLAMLGCQTAYGQWSLGSGNKAFSNICSDYMYRFRVAVTPRRYIVYAILCPTNQIAAWAQPPELQGLPAPSWTSPTIPGLNVTQPVLNVDTTTDRVYFVHPEEGRIYCYDATLNVSTPVWVSDFVCTSVSDARNQSLQTFSANGTRLFARCNDSIVMLDEGGRLVKTFGGPAVAAFVNNADLAAPLPIYANFTKFLTWAAVPPDSDSAPPSRLAVWDTAVRTDRPTRPSASIPLPDGAMPGGVNADSPWLLAVADAAAPLLHLISSFNGVIQSTFDFGPILDPGATLTNFTVLPTPAIANRTVYGVVQGVLPSPTPWIPSTPDKFFWWAFALNITSPKQPSLLWNTSRLSTRGPLAPQAPLVRNSSIIVADYMQNGTRSFWRNNGSDFFNVPANPYSSNNGAYFISRGVYKISLPWVHPDGRYLVFQHDDWTYDLAAPDARGRLSPGGIRTMRGDPFCGFLCGLRGGNVANPPPPTSGFGRRRR